MSYDLMKPYIGEELVAGGVTPSPVEEIALTYVGLVEAHAPDMMARNMGAAEFCRAVMGVELSPVQERLLDIVEALPDRSLILGTGRAHVGPMRVSMMAALGQLLPHTLIAAAHEQAAEEASARVVREAELIQAMRRGPGTIVVDSLVDVETEPPPRNRKERRRAAALARRAG